MTVIKRPLQKPLRPPPPQRRLPPLLQAAAPDEVLLRAAVADNRKRGIRISGAYKSLKPRHWKPFEKRTEYKQIMNKLPKFFCENCGKEVKRNTKVCPYCGKFFASVKCPACNYLGGTDEFVSGCPACGYAVHSNTEKNTKRYRNDKIKETSVKYKENRYDDPLPWWVYSLVLGIAAALIIATVLR